MLEEKLLASLTNGITQAIEQQVGTIWAFDNLDEVLNEELTLLAKDLIRNDPQVRDAMRNRLLDVVDPLPEDYEEEEQSESEEDMVPEDEEEPLVEEPQKTTSKKKTNPKKKE